MVGIVWVVLVLLGAAALEDAPCSPSISVFL